MIANQLNMLWLDAPIFYQADHLSFCIVSYKKAQSRLCLMVGSNDDHQSLHGIHDLSFLVLFLLGTKQHTFSGLKSFGHSFTFL